MEWVFKISNIVNRVLEEEGIENEELAFKIGGEVRRELLSFLEEKLNDVIDQ